VPDAAGLEPGHLSSFYGSFILYEGRIVIPLWTSASLDAGFILINERRAEGDSSFDRKVPFKRRISTRQRKRAERRSSGFFSSTLRPAKKVGPCQALHRSADNIARTSPRLIWYVGTSRLLTMPYAARRQRARGHLGCWPRSLGLDNAPRLEPVDVGRPVKA
jgi:hypothetical protein